MMRTFSLGAMLLATAVAGCSPPKVHLPPSPPHGGTAFTLPEGKGFVEVLRQDAPEQSGHTQLVVYFLDPACKPLGGVSGVSFMPKARDAAPTELKPIGDSDPSKAGGLATAPFPDPGEITGLLLATIENKPVSVAVTLR